jgi:pectate lyase
MTSFRKQIQFLAISLIALLISGAHALSTAEEAEIPAFTGAEGWGANIPAGRGGKVIIVDTLADSGEGSLRAALNETGPRIIVFRVSGVIDLKKKEAFKRYLDLKEKHSHFRVAGQTSPGGITLLGRKVAITGCYREHVKDFAFRFIRFRSITEAGGQDCVEFNSSSHFIIDHCDFSGGTDGTLDITSSDNFTLQWSTIAHSNFKNRDHGGSTFPNAHHTSLHHNIWAHHENRCGGFMNYHGRKPVDNGLIDYRNNICYDGIYICLKVRHAKSPVHVNLVGNWFITGPNTQERKYRQKRIWNDVDLGCCTVYEKDNIMIDDEGKKRTIADVHPDTEKEKKSWRHLKIIGERAEKPFDMPPVTTYSSSNAYEKVLNKCGAMPRDQLNHRLAKNIREQSGKLKDFKAPWIQEGPEPPADSDRDGMPDFWEKAMGFNPDNASDNIKDHDGDGYTNIEEYLNDLAQVRLGREYENKVYPIPENWPDYVPPEKR